MASSPSESFQNARDVLTAFIVLAVTASILAALVFVGFLFRKHYNANIEETAKKERFVQIDHRERRGGDS